MGSSLTLAGVDEVALPVLEGDLAAVWALAGEVGIEFHLRSNLSATRRISPLLEATIRRASA